MTRWSCWAVSRIAASSTRRSRRLDDFRRVRSLAGWPNLLERMHGMASANDMPPTVRAADGASAAAPTAVSLGGACGKRAFRLLARAPRADTRRGRTDRQQHSRPCGCDSARRDGLRPRVRQGGHRRRFQRHAQGAQRALRQRCGSREPWMGRGYHTTALAIDPKRGDLWVVGARTNAGQSESVVHRMQLISGRLLYSVPLARGFRRDTIRGCRARGRQRARARRRGRPDLRAGRRRQDPSVADGPAAARSDGPRARWRRRGVCGARRRTRPDRSRDEAEH